MLRRLAFRLWITGVLALVLSLQIVHGQTPDSARTAPGLITQSVDEGNLVALRGNTRPEAVPGNDQGPVADSLPMEHMLLQLRRPPEQEIALDRFIEEVEDPASPNFHKWLTPDQFGENFGVAQQDLDVITRWLQSHGFTVNVVYASRIVIDFSGTAGQVREAFHTEIHNFDVRGQRHIANMSDPEIPLALAPAVVGIVSMHDFLPRPMVKMRSNYTFTSGGIQYQAVVPADLATIYNLNPLFSAPTNISGQGQTIVVIEDSNAYSTSDWTNFRSTFGLSGYTSGSFTTVHPAPGTNGSNCSNPGVNGDSFEAELDVEYASAAAPSATIELASCRNTFTTFGGLIAIQNLINASTPPAIMSVSYGECEAENGVSANAAYSSAFQQATSEGVSVFVSSGDEGAASCDANGATATHGIGVNGFASTPYNVAVGGTDFGDTYANANSLYWNSTNTPTYGSAKSYIPEIPWNDSCASELIATFEGNRTTYGSTGFCNSTTGEGFLTVDSGSGGPSGCATGTPSISGVVSGTCKGYGKPSWQLAFGNAADGVRDIPDVSLFAANGIWGHYYPVCYTDARYGGSSCSGAPSSWPGAGGTSFASPIMAGFQALVNQKTSQHWGNPDPVYYQLAATEANSSGSSCNSANGYAVASTCMFYDVTQGDMDVNCTGSNNCYLPSGAQGVLSILDGSYHPSYGATTGWDFATGIGTVNAANLVNNWPNSGASAPPAPTLVSATASSPTEIDLLWTNPAGTSATGNSVLRCTGANCTPTTVIASLSAGATAYQDTSVSSVTTYVYLIEATGPGGSASSNTLSGTTPSPILTPQLSVTKTHHGSFTQGQQGANYTVTVSNAAGALATSGTVTVTELIPVGLQLTSMSGSGWNCPVGGNVCTRNDALSAGSSYPSITVTMNVTGSSAVTNQVKVSGGGSPTAIANDPTVIFGTSNGCAGTPSGDESLLKGTYAFLAQGYVGTNNLSPVALAGSFTADGQGNITGGEEDINTSAASGGYQHLTIKAGSFYTVSTTSNAGCLALIYSGGTTTVATSHFALGGIGQGAAPANVASLGRIIEFDDDTGSGTRVSGILRFQTTSTFAVGQLQSRYAFGLDGGDFAGDRFAMAGSFDNGNGNLTNLAFDSDDAGTLQTNITGGTGSISGISAATGRGAFTITAGGNTSHEEIYIVNANELFVVQTDAFNSSTPILGGRAIVTPASYTAASLSGKYIAHLTGNNAGVADINLGILNVTPGAGANGTFTGNITDYNGTAASSTAPSGDYTVDAALGRTAPTGLTNPLVLYITTPTDGISAFAVGTGSTALFGLLEAQTGVTIPLGNYIFATEDPGDNNVAYLVGTVNVVAPSPGTANFTFDQSTESYLLTGSTITGAPVSTASDGTGTFGGASFYITNGTKVFLVVEAGTANVWVIEP